MRSSIIKFKYLKTSVCLLIIFSLLFQSLPSSSRAIDLKKALIGLWNFLFAKIKLPEEIRITEKGDLLLGRWPLIRCIDKDERGECVNPFSIINLGTAGKVSLIDKKGRPAIPKPKIPEICSLKIPQAPEEEYLSREEKLALSQACLNLRRIQKAAASQVYFGKKIYNSTDPLSDCLFLKNCKSSCKLRFGKITYTISAFDIVMAVAGVFLPVTWIQTIKKIFNVVAKVQEILNVITQIKDLINLGIGVLNSFFQNLAYLSTLYSSLSNILQIESEEGFRALLSRYSENLFLFSQAKSEAFSLIEEEKQETKDLKKSLQESDKVKLLFSDDEESKQKRKELQEIIDNYLSRLETAQQIFLRFKKIEESLANIPQGKGKITQVEISCPKRVTGCYFNESKSSLPYYCSVNCQPGQCDIFCPEKIGFWVECQDNGIRTYEFGSLDESEKWVCSFSCEGRSSNRVFASSTCPEVPGGCYVSCLESCNFACQEKGCSVSWQAENHWHFSCPERECQASYPQEFGSYILDCPKIPGEIVISCPGTCEISCPFPSNEWFQITLEFYQKAKDLSEKFSKYFNCTEEFFRGDLRQKEADCRTTYLDGEDEDEDKALTLFNQLIDLRQRLIQKIADLPKDEEGRAQYWRFENHQVRANDFNQAEEEGKEICEYDARVLYLGWQGKIKEILRVDLPRLAFDFNQVLEELRNLPIGSPPPRQPSPTAQERIEKIENFWRTPLINYQILDEALKKIAQLEKEVAEDTEIYSKVSPLLTNLKRNLEKNLKNKFSEINRLWQEGISSARQFIEKVIETRDISQEIEDIITQAENNFNQIRNQIRTVGGEELFQKVSSLLNDLDQSLFKASWSIKNIVGTSLCLPQYQ